MQTKRRAKRSHHPVAPVFRWNHPKRRILELLSEYHILRITDLVELIHGTEGNDVKRRSLQATLGILRKAEYVGRLPFVDDASDDLFHLTYAYYLTDSGAALVENPVARLSKESTYIPRHEIEIVQFHIRLKAWADARSLILRWHQPKMDYGRDINPDAYFGIEDPTLPEGRNNWHYFLEIERAKIGNYKNGEPSIIRKLAKYYEFYDSADCEKQWGFRKFRVITVVRNADKQYNLCERLAPKYPNRMFWITTEPHVKEGIGGEIFRTPRDHTKTAYSFLSQ